MTETEKDGQAAKVAINAETLHVLPDADAIRLFDEVLGRGTAWQSELMQYRTTSDFQADWKVEVGNWLARARLLGFLDEVLRNVVPQQQLPGSRDADDPAHRNVHQQLAQAMVVHYFVGTGWSLHAYEPQLTEARASGTRADVDLQFVVPTGEIVDLQVKASGSLGIPLNTVDQHIQGGVRKAASQLPTSAVRPAFICMLAQRDWPLSAEIPAVTKFVGSTAGYPDGTVLLHDEKRGEFASWPHVSGIIVLDHRRSIDFSDYSCVVIENPWAIRRLDPAWFPHARVLVCRAGTFDWLRGVPYASAFPPGTSCYAGSTDDAFELHGVRRSR